MEQIPILLYWALALLAGLPLVSFQISLAAYFLLVHLKLTGVGYESAVALNLENAIAIVIVPTILLLRTRFAGFRLLKGNWAFRLWILFVLYCAAASFWSPFRLSAFKQLGYFYSFSVMVAVLAYAFHKEKEKTYRTILWCLFPTLLLALMQTFLFGNLSGGEADRLTTFANPQAFGGYLAFTLAIILSFADQRLYRKSLLALLVAVILVFLYLNGSRSGMGGALLLLAAYGFMWGRSSQAYARLGMGLAYFNIAILLGWTLVSGVAGEFLPRNFVIQSNRALQGAGVISGRVSFSDIGTFRFRLRMAETILDRYSRKPLMNRVFGSGTSSAGELIALGFIQYRDYDRYSVDANRTAHNEFLRSLYEWGIIGSMVFLAFVVSLIAGVVKIVRERRSLETWMPAGAVFVVVFLFFPVENILAASGSPMGMGISAVLGLLVARSVKSSPRVQVSNPKAAFGVRRMGASPALRKAPSWQPRVAAGRRTFAGRTAGNAGRTSGFDDHAEGEKL